MSETARTIETWRATRRLAFRHCVFGLAILFLAPVLALAQSSSPDYARDIRPLISDRCLACHGPDAETREADLRLDLNDDWEARGAIRAGDPNQSHVWLRITSQDPDLRMPPDESGKTLTADEQELIKRWIESGAEVAEHWAYRPLRAQAPAESLRDLPSAIDAWVEQAQQSRGLSWAPQADDWTLLRRVTLDLTGLPPSPEAVAQYMADPREDKYERWVDHLLESDSYGERMASFWFDLVRYADTVGYHGDQDHPIGPYRDWVIHALNHDMPFDQFSTWQLAGDLVAPDEPHAVIATGYLRVLQTSHEGGIQPGEYLAKYSADRARNFSEVWLGSTIGCAECHDHKYDPFTQADFYSLAAFFADIDDRGTFEGTNTLPTRREPEREVASPLDEDRLGRLLARRESLEQQLAQLPAGDERIAELQVEQQALVEASNRLEQRRYRTMIARAIEPRVIRILPRGNWLDESGEILLPQVPVSLGEVSASTERPTRADLAGWLFEQNQALTARVLANRLWAKFFGVGLSKQLADYGAQGTAPSHPELLDELARHLIAGQWHLKPWIRSVVLSRAYRQSSTPNPSRDQRDPGQTWLTRQRRIRLDAEVIRDQALAAAGLLVDEPGGASCRPYQPAGYYAHLNFPPRAYYADEGPRQYRRGVYVHWQRQFLHPMLRAFDAPMREECTAQRSLSNTPSQALTLLNDPTFVEAAHEAARQELVAISGEDTPITEQAIDAALENLWRRLLVRPMEPREKQILRDLYEASLNDPDLVAPEAAELLAIGQQRDKPQPPTRHWLAFTAVARALLNLDETVTRP